MRDRLIELIRKASSKIYSELLEKEGGHEKEIDVAEYVADHLLASGVIVPPCKVGTRVYRLVPDLSVMWPDPTGYKIVWDTFRLSDIYSFGKTVFLTREDAEKALKGDV